MRLPTLTPTPSPQSPKIKTPSTQTTQNKTYPDVYVINVDGKADHSDYAGYAGFVGAYEGKIAGRHEIMYCNYDKTNQKTFQQVEDHIKKVRGQKATQDTPIAITMSFGCNTESMTYSSLATQLRDTCGQGLREKELKEFKEKGIISPKIKEKLLELLYNNYPERWEDIQIINRITKENEDVYFTTSMGNSMDQFNPKALCDKILNVTAPHRGRSSYSNHTGTVIDTFAPASYVANPLEDGGTSTASPIALGNWISAKFNPDYFKTEYQENSERLEALGINMSKYPANEYIIEDTDNTNIRDAEKEYNYTSKVIYIKNIRSGHIELVVGQSAPGNYFVEQYHTDSNDQNIRKDLDSDLFKEKINNDILFVNSESYRTQIYTPEATSVRIDGEAIIKSLNKNRILDFSQFKNLAKLDLSGCENLKDLRGIKNLTNLTELNLNNCQNLKSLKGIKNLLNLTSLNLSDCENLKDIGGIKNLLNLTSLDLSWCKNLKDLGGIENLSNLTSLDLSQCKNLKDIGGIENLSNLTELNLSGCENLKDIGGIKNLLNLTTLDLSWCENLTDLKDIKKLTNLTTLNLINCENLTDLKGIENFKNLTELDLSWCKNLTDLKDIENLPNLTTLDLKHTGVTNLPQSLFKSPTLKEIEIAKDQFTTEQLKEYKQLAADNNIELTIYYY